MTKMSTPEMDVIRFSESDVIVASGGIAGKTLSISGVGDGKEGNAFLTIGGTPYSSNLVVSSDSQFVTGYNDYMSGLSTYSEDILLRSGQNSLFIKTALGTDADGLSDSSYSWIDGTYGWSNDALEWHWLHQ